MDKEGYLALSFIASFPRVQNLTRDLNVIAAALSDSDKVDLDNTHMRVRTRINPESWPMELPSQSLEETVVKAENESPAGPSGDSQPVEEVKPAEVIPPKTQKPVPEPQTPEDVSYINNNNIIF